MNKEEFINKCDAKIINRNILNQIYDVCDLSNEENCKAVLLMMPAICDLYYYKNQFIENINEKINNNFYDDNTNVLSENEKMIKELLDNNISVEHISKFIIQNNKKIILDMFSDYTVDGELSNPILVDKFDKEREEGVSLEEFKEKEFRGTWKLYNIFDALCNMLCL